MLSLSRKTKHQLIILLLIVAFTGLGFVIVDVKSPTITQDTCYFVGQGLLIKDWKKNAALLYSNDGRETHDIGLSCREKGLLWLNDTLIYPPKKGQALQLVTTRYQWLPTRHRLELPVVNTDPLELETQREQSAKTAAPKGAV